MSEITNSPIGLDIKTTLSEPRRRRLNLSEGHPMFVIVIYPCPFFEQGYCNFPDKFSPFWLRLVRAMEG